MTRSTTARRPMTRCDSVISQAVRRDVRVVDSTREMSGVTHRGVDLTVRTAGGGEERVLLNYKLLEKLLLIFYVNISLLFMRLSILLLELRIIFIL